MAASAPFREGKIANRVGRSFRENQTFKVGSLPNLPKCIQNQLLSPVLRTLFHLDCDSIRPQEVTFRTAEIALVPHSKIASHHPLSKSLSGFPRDCGQKFALPGFQYVSISLSLGVKPVVRVPRFVVGYDDEDIISNVRLPSKILRTYFT